MPFSKKRTFKKRRGATAKRRTTLSSKPKVSFAVKNYVKKTIHRGVENKYHLAYANNQTVGAPYILSLVPNINFGNQHSQRIGNRVTVMSSRVEFVINNNVYNATTNPFNNVTYRWFLMSQKKENSTTFDSGGFFEINNSSTNIQNNHLDQILKVNDSKYTVHRQGRFNLGSTSTSTAFPSANSQFDNSKLFCIKKLYYNKYMAKKLMYDDGGTTPTNTNCWLIIIPTYSNGSSMSGYIPGNISYTIHTSYEDA